MNYPQNLPKICPWDIDDTETEVFFDDVSIDIYDGAHNDPVTVIVLTVSVSNQGWVSLSHNGKIINSVKPEVQDDIIQFLYKKTDFSTGDLQFNYEVSK